jgi:hypothetical protein
MVPTRMRSPLLLLALLALGCSDADVAGLPAGAADGLHPQIQVVGGAARSGELRVWLLRKPSGTRLGSYQGELTYDAASLRVVGSRFPDGADGVVNAAAPGRMRFVGTALDGVGEEPLLVVRFERRGAIVPEALGVTFEEVTAATDLADLSGALRAELPPLVAP